MALKLGRFCGNGPEVWLRMQAAHDLWEAAQEMGKKQLQKISSHAVA